VVQRDLVLEIACEPPFVASAHFALDAVQPGDEVVARDLKPLPDLARLRDLIEADTATVRARLRRDGQEVAEATVPLRVLAHNEWDSGGRRDLLAAFIMPNHPAITELVSAARDLQQAEFGRPEFEGYQSRDPVRVAQQSAAIYGALQRLGITYLAMPASFEEHGQKLRSPDALRGEKQGNCIDVATWSAAALEACGLRPVIVLLRGHAYAGVWLTDEPHSLDPVETDAATVRKQVQAGRLLLIETTAATTRPSPSFAEAWELGLTKINDVDFREMIDVQSARVAGVRPLNVAAEAAAASAGVPVAAPDLTLPSASPTPATPRAAAARGRFDKWVAELMDLSLRNDLIGGTMIENPEAFGGRRPKKGLLLAASDVAALENDLADGKKFRLILDAPAGPTPSDQQARKLWEQMLGDLQKRQQLVVDPGVPALPEKARRMWKQHRELVEEKGASSLHVAIGALRWFESESSQQPRYAPLLLVPAQLERVSLAGEFSLSSGDGETVLNGALVQKLAREFGVDLAPLAADLPVDDCGIDVGAVFSHVTEQVMRLRRFEVVPIATLGFFEYRKQLMARDLRAMVESGAAAPNPFLASLLPELAREMREHYADAGSVRLFIEPMALDDHIPAAQMPLVVDADSSQVAAVHAALEGQSFVLQGPPGTGKSQTITNMIACLLAAGKRVLFVAEKRAALSVVANRLAKVGLDSACLELHGEAPNGGTVAQSLVAALDAARPDDSAEFDRLAREVDQTRVRLNALVRRLHRPTPLGMSFFQASARRHALREHVGPPIEVTGIRETTADAFEANRRALADLQRAIADCGGWSDHPLRASRLDTWTERRQDAAGNALASLAEAVTIALSCLDDAAAALGVDAGVAARDPDAVVEMLKLLATAPPGWVRELCQLPQRDDYVSALDELRDVATRRTARLARLSERWTDGFHELDLASLAAAIRAAQPKWSLARWWAMRGPRRALRGVAKGKLGLPDESSRTSTTRSPPGTRRRESRRRHRPSSS
jgi:hypothetical protein